MNRVASVQRVPDCLERCPAVLIIERSQAQILPPLLGKAGQRPDRQTATGLLDRLSAVCPRDWALERGRRHEGLAPIGIFFSRMADCGRGVQPTAAAGT